VIFAIFTKVCRVFYHFCRDFLLSLQIACTQYPQANYPAAVRIRAIRTAAG